MNKEQFKHKIKIKVRFSDLDAMRHVNNATYLTYLEEARIEYFNRIFNRSRSDLNFQAVVGKIDISYLHPIELGDDVEVYTRVSKFGNKSVDVEHLITVNKSNEIINSAYAITKLVFYDYKNKTTTIIPEEIKQIIKKYEENSQ